MKTPPLCWLRPGQAKQCSSRTRKRRNSEVFARGLAYLRNRGAGKYFRDLFLDFTPNANHRAPRQLIATEVLVHAGIHGDRSLDRLDYIIERNFLGGTGQRVPSGSTPLGLDEPLADQVLDDFLQEFPGDTLGSGDFGYGAAALDLLAREIDHGSKAVINSARNLHQAHCLPPFARFWLGSASRSASFPNAERPRNRWTIKGNFSFT